ncbi:hypothetical protein ABT297_32190 [Dactylosporangium sp. NPDC000555]|uniref:hypothetical protein n=1 Tax=Dactylosporangium sp. NPDC000555 TaxID=3154260 RepID=UPI00331F9A64
MDGHWEWSDGGDDANTADLSGDTGHDLHGGFAEDYGADFADGHLHAEFGAEDHDLGGGHLDSRHGGDDLEEPLGTEHAAAEYDQALHDTTDAHDPGHDHTDTRDHTDSDHADTTDDQHEAAFGADPDVQAGADDPAWHEAQFPEPLHLQDPPEPVDGFPWSDADVLGGPDHSLSAAFDPAVTGHGPAEPGGLADYAGVDVPSGADAWSLLLGSDDPAASSLATFWAPQ